MLQGASTLRRKQRTQTGVGASSAGHAAEQKGGERIVGLHSGLVGEEGVDPAAAADR